MIIGAQSRTCRVVARRAKSEPMSTTHHEAHEEHEEKNKKFNAERYKFGIYPAKLERV